MDTNLGAKAVGHLKLRRALSLQVSPEGLEKVNELPVFEFWEGTQAGMSSTVTCRLRAVRASSRRMAEANTAKATAVTATCTVRGEVAFTLLSPTLYTRSMSHRFRSARP